MKSKISLLSILAVVGVSFTGCRSVPPHPGPISEGFTAYNMWYERADTLDTVNYKVGPMIPAGTAVRNIMVQPQQRAWHRGDRISFTTADGATYTALFTASHHPGMTADSFCQVMFSPKNFDELTAGFTESEIEAIKKGVILPGMSKEAVRVSWGKPPEHSNPSPDVANQWLYWKTRFKKVTVFFDEAGKVTAAPEGMPGT
ncbi:MAG: hypothetical protein HY812_08005 [Planctomycetes bacterium]|nr:hypothetical protein [Planctomycetota bacterium]